MLDILILCAGKGTRLLPLTNLTPKPLLNLTQNQSILSRLVRQFDGKVEKIYVNISYLANKFIDGAEPIFLKKCYFVWEPEILGSFKTLKLVSKLNKNSLLVIHGDLVLSDIGISHLLNEIFQNPQKSLLVVHERIRNLARSVVDINENHTVLGFHEITTRGLSYEKCFSSSGIYYFSKDDLLLTNFIASNLIGQDLTSIFLPLLIEQRLLNAHFWTTERVSVDSLESLAIAQSLIQNTRL